MDKREIYKRTTEIDHDLKIKKLLIFQRPLNAIFEYQKRFNISFDLNSETAKTIFEWYDFMYGDNIKINLSKKNYLIKIKSDIFVLGSPFFYGSLRLMWGEGEIKKPETMSRTTIDFDVRNLIDYITPLYSMSMSSFDIDLTLKWIFKINNINDYFKEKINEKTNDMYDIVYKDLISAKEHFMINSYDMAEWQCLQVAEKLLKMYIVKHKNQEPKRIHILSQLNDVAQINDPTILSLIPLLETHVSYRYELKSSRQDAFNKYEATINFIDSMIKIL